MVLVWQRRPIELNRVDRLWAILPVLYSFHYLTFAALHGLVSPRLLLISTFQLFWGIRLTFNYWRKGGFSRSHHSLCPSACPNPCQGLGGLPMGIRSEISNGILANCFGAVGASHF
jgi:hypothetical protein